MRKCTIIGIRFVNAACAKPSFEHEVKKNYAYLSYVGELRSNLQNMI